MSEIKLTKGFVALVDDADYPDLSQFRWSAFANGWGQVYAVRYERVRKGKYRTVYMHRQLMPGAEMVDHINGNSLDNRRANLRAASNTQNQWNRRGVNRGNTSGYLGIFWDKDAWRARIRVNGRVIYLGRFHDPIEAAKARDAAALQYHGEFATLNFPVDPQGEVA